jgi:hypothetical protein
MIPFETDVGDCRALIPTDERARSAYFRAVSSRSQPRGVKGMPVNASYQASQAVRLTARALFA